MVLTVTYQTVRMIPSLLQSFLRIIKGVMMRGDQLARQWRILRHIEASLNGLTIAEIGEAEGISLRTAYRDVEALQEAGFPLFSRRVDNTNRWAFVDTYKFQVPQPFTLTELMSLQLYSDLVRIFQGTTFYDSLETLFKKVRVTLPPHALAYLERVQSTFSIGIKPYKEYGKFKEIINQINQAVIESRSVEIMYHALKRKSQTLRKIDPYKLWFFEGTIYVIGHCHLRREVRTFVIDRIKMLRLTDETFTTPADFDLNDVIGHSFKVMRDELHTVIVRISPEWSRWAGEKMWHESQQVRTLPDGGLELAFRVAGLDEVKMWILSLGPEARAIAPLRLVEMVREDLRKTYAQYEHGISKTGPALNGGQAVMRKD